MDPRSKKPCDFVAATRNLSEEVQKTRLLQIKWFQKYEWILDEHMKLRQEIKDLCEEKHPDTKEDCLIREDKKTCLPAPVTTSAEYGWLAMKSEFQLEKYGSYFPKYPDPLSDVTPLPGNMPLLAVGKGFIL